MSDFVRVERRTNYDGHWSNMGTFLASEASAAIIEMEDLDEDFLGLRAEYRVRPAR